MATISNTPHLEEIRTIRGEVQIVHQQLNLSVLVSAVTDANLAGPVLAQHSLPAEISGRSPCTIWVSLPE